MGDMADDFSPGGRCAMEPEEYYSMIAEQEEYEHEQKKKKQNIMKNSKVKEIKNGDKPREWKGPKGTVWYYDVVMENGDEGNIGVQDKGSLKVGDGFHYVMDGDKIKRKKSPESGGYDTTGIIIGNALNNATLLICNDKAGGKKLEETTRGIVDLALKLKEEYSNK